MPMIWYRCWNYEIKTKQLPLKIPQEIKLNILEPNRKNKILRKEIEVIKKNQMERLDLDIMTTKFLKNALDGVNSRIDRSEKRNSGLKK